MPRNTERHQHLERSQMELRDQHDRVWLVESEVGLTERRRPQLVAVGQFVPSFTTPYDFLPDAKYLTYSPSKPGRLVIEYGAWETSIVDAHNDVADQLRNLAVAIYKGEAAKYIKEPTTEMLEIVYGRGKGPEPVEPIRAARQGNGWILGLRPFDETIKGDVLLKGYMETWVAIRYRDIRGEDRQIEGDGQDFTEGQKKRKLATV